jgi:transposase
LPELARHALRLLAEQFATLDDRIEAAERAILAWHKEQEASRRLASVPGIGPVTASAVVATIGRTPWRGRPDGKRPARASCLRG